MFVEGEVEVKVKDYAALAQDDHALKLWLQRAFANASCYRISNFRREADKVVRAVVALKFADLPAQQRQEIEQNPHDVALLRHFLERMFNGKGVCRAIGEAKVRPV